MVMLDLERRAFAALDLSLEARAEGGLPVLRGYAAVFNQISEDLGGFREQVAPGAFAETIQQDDIRALWNHNDDLVLGRNRSGTLRLREDSRGLAIEVDLPDTSWARDVAELVRRGDVSGMSFGFRTIEDSWERTAGGELRTLRKVRLFDVSPVTFPAYPQTDVALRSLEAWRQSQDRTVRGSDGDADAQRRWHRLLLLAPELRRAIRPHSTPTDTESSWDGPAAVEAAPNDAAILRYMHAWADTEGDPDAKGTYKFPHHQPRAGAPAVIAAVNNALARLSQADIPDADRAGVEAHLRRHRRDAGLED